MLCRVALVILCFGLPVAVSSGAYAENKPPLSEATEECLSCHSLFSPGIAHDWSSSRHAANTVEMALKKPGKERRVSLDSVEKARGLTGYVAVGCAECHTLNPDLHEDTFLHNGYKVHVVVTPTDCANCHPIEKAQYTNHNKMAHAYGNLHDNPLYRSLVETVLGRKQVRGDSLQRLPSTLATQMDTCYGCHGTRVRVIGMREIETAMDVMEVPKLAGWPNTGVGRVNPDGSLGCCTACHPRHAFSIVAARQPYVCSQCHLQPDVPAWNVYKESKHGNLFSTLKHTWDFDAVPWRLGRDFRAPTCATCHASLVVDPEGAVIADRTHGYGERLWTRLFGLIYSHPQPIAPDTRSIRNRDGQPLPVTFDGEPAIEHLIDLKTQKKRKRGMKAICQGCHSTQWVEQHFFKMDGTLEDVNQAVRTATQLMQRAWEKGIASEENPFDESIEIIWTEQWLFFANSVRFASAMAGAPDYASFHNGWWEIQKAIEEIRESTERNTPVKVRGR
jgi:hypothetical protein